MIAHRFIGGERTRAQGALGTIETPTISSKPSVLTGRGSSSPQNPALKRWTTISRPSGTQNLVRT